MARHHQGAVRRIGVVLPAAAIAAVVVAAFTVTAYVMSPHGNGAASLAQAIDSLPKSGSVAALEAEQKQLSLMSAATSVLTTDSKAAVVSPAQVESESTEQSTEQSQETATSQTTTTTTPPPADPTSAEQIGEQLMLDAGFASSQWSCLYDLWERESGWNVYAENPTSGAYGIPQSLPASKMSEFGSDYLTDPTTQIKWGLSYISSTYGTPCDAYTFDIDNGGY